MYIISAVLDKSSATVALYDKEYKLLQKKGGACENAASLCSEIISEAGIKTSDVEFIGVAANDTSASAEMEKATGIKCLGATVVGAKALGEAYTANDVATLIVLNVDETVECGIVIDKKLYCGTHGHIGDFGHMVINFDGYECSCGRRGCFEAYASNGGLRRIAADAGVTNAKDIDHRTLFSADTPEAKTAKRLYMEYLASGITNIINLFQPREFVLEGPFTEVGDALMDEMMEIILRDQYTHSMPDKSNIRFANTAADTVLLGAALLGR